AIRLFCFLFFFQAEDGIRDRNVTGVRRVLFRSSSDSPARRTASWPPKGSRSSRSAPARSWPICLPNTRANRFPSRMRRPHRCPRSEERRVGKEGGRGGAGGRGEREGSREEGWRR